MHKEWNTFEELTNEVTFMPNRFQGIYAPHIEQIIAFKRAVVFKYQTSILAVFDRFTLEHVETDGEIPDMFLERFYQEPWLILLVLKLQL